ncbi:TPM domain-containing protein [Mycobacterium sp. 050134]|uniref:TPM domain-containing protein n=1 Tax=Mycobacterium sp. 050134 TaxID=3096111 RepID=UPI002ED79904
MRVVRLCGVVLAILTAGLLLTTPAGAQPPSTLTDHITDNTGALTDPQRVAVSSAIDRLYRDRRIQLWVVYVDNFSRFRPDNWADKTRSASGLGDHDVLLAVATNTKLYAFSVPPGIQGLTTAEVGSLRTRQIDPAVATKDWGGAAVAAADGLNKVAAPDSSASSSKRRWLLIAIGAVAAVVVLLAIVALYRRRRAARRVDPGGGQPNLEAGTTSVTQALATADGRVRQISDYVARHADSVGADAKAHVEGAKRYLDAARGTEGTNDADAIAYANRASTLAAEAQTLANSDVLGGHRTQRRRSAR